MRFNKVSVIGLGYIGLPTAAVLASRKVNVVGVDVDKNAVDTINKGEIHIVEPDLDKVVRTAVTKGFLKATLKPEPADAFLVAVPTPFKEGHEPDLSYIQAASNSIAPVLKKGDLVILESTSPVGATEKMAEWLSAVRPDLTFPQAAGNEADIKIAHCPERVLPGHILRELVKNDRVIGGMSENCSEVAADLYNIFVEGNCVITNSRTAELCKLTENSFRDVNLAFANELSLICDELHVNVRELISLSNLHPRVNILQPGPGVGGHCIAVDPWFIVDSAPDTSKVIRTARDVNDSKPAWVCEKIKQILQEKGLNHVVCMGLTYKPDVDDLRESPSLKIYYSLRNDGGFKVSAVEPFLPDGGPAIDLIDVDDIHEEALVVGLVAHSEFKKIDFKANEVLDFAGIWEK